MISSLEFRKTLIEYGIDESKIIPYFQHEKVSLELEREVIERNTLEILFAGNIGQAQGLDRLVNISEILKKKDYMNIHFRIIGEGRYKQKLLQNISKRGLNDYFTFYDPVPKEELTKYYNQADFGLVILDNNEAINKHLPAKVQGYMANKVPILAVASGEVKRILKESEAGLCIEFSDIDDMTEELIAISKMPKHEIHLLGENGYYYALNNFNLEDQVKQLESVFKELMNKEEYKVKEKESKMKDVLAKVYDESIRDFYTTIYKNLESSNQKVIVTANPEIVMHSEKNDLLLKELMNHQTLITADGIGVVKACKMLLGKNVERITGVDIVEEILKHAEEKNYKVLVYGTKQEVLDKFNEKMEAELPNLELKLINGYDYDMIYVQNVIHQIKPNIVLTCLGVPRQETVNFELSKSTNDVVYIGCGGSIDVISGSLKRAPIWIQKFNLEWFYRIVKQPKRIKRFINNQVVFAFKVLRLK